MIDSQKDIQTMLKDGRKGDYSMEEEKQRKDFTLLELMNKI